MARFAGRGVADAVYRLFGWWYRWQACKCAAATMRADDDPVKLWSYAVFFETYMLDGAGGTEREFGPKDPVSLKSVGE